MTKESFETHKYGIVHRRTQSVRKDQRQRLADAKILRKEQNLSRQSELRKHIDKRIKALGWLKNNVTENLKTELPRSSCPICKKSVFLCKTPGGFIAWLDHNKPPWRPHHCAYDRGYPSVKFTQTEMKCTPLINSAYVQLRHEIDEGRGG